MNEDIQLLRDGINDKSSHERLRHLVRPALEKALFSSGVDAFFTELRVVVAPVEVWRPEATPIIPQAIRRAIKQIRMKIEGDHFRHLNEGLQYLAASGVGKWQTSTAPAVGQMLEDLKEEDRRRNRPPGFLWVVIPTVAAQEAWHPAAARAVKGYTVSQEIPGWEIVRGAVNRIMASVEEPARPATDSQKQGRQRVRGRGHGD
jgi:hypothetical protein